MYVKDMAAKKGELPIAVGTKVCRYTDRVYTNGVVSAITTTKKGKQKVAQSLFTIMFEDKEKLNCGLDTVRAMQACFTSRVKVARVGSEASKAQKALVPEGFNLYTHWTPELSVLAPASKPPPFRTGKYDSWLRKATLQKFHAALNEYEIEYACGFSRYLKVGDMQQMITDSDQYKKSNQAHLIQLLQYADEEFMGTKVNTTGKIARAGAKLRANRAVGVIVPETPAASQNHVLDEVPTADIAASNKHSEDKIEQPQQKEDSAALPAQEDVFSHKVKEVQLDDTVGSEVGKAAGKYQGDATGSGKGPDSEGSELALAAMELVELPAAVEVSSQKAIQDELLETDEEFMGPKVNTTGKIARAGAKLRANRAVGVIVPETPAASQNDVLDEVPTCDIAASNQDSEDKMEQPQQKEDSAALPAQEEVFSHKAKEVQLDDTVGSEVGKAAGKYQGDATGSGKGPDSEGSELALAAMELVELPAAVEVSSQKAIQEELLETVEPDVEKAAGQSKQNTACTEYDEAAKGSEEEAAALEASVESQGTPAGCENGEAVEGSEVEAAAMELTGLPDGTNTSTRQHIPPAPTDKESDVHQNQGSSTLMAPTIPFPGWDHPQLMAHFHISVLNTVNVVGFVDVQFPIMEWQTHLRKLLPI
jgi:hypothetical protein